jgi:hypothetical protein
MPSAGRHAHLRQHTRAEGIRILQAHPSRSRRAAACARRSSGTPPIPPPPPSCATISNRIPGQRAHLISRNEKAGADELRHRAHSRRARRLCGAQRAPSRRSQSALHRAPAIGAQPTAAPPPVWASCACSRKTSRRHHLSSPRPSRTATKQNRRNALANSRFWLTMSEATQAFDQNQLDVPKPNSAPRST